jgi:hypothetical protein
MIGHKGAVRCLHWATWVSNTYQRIVSWRGQDCPRQSLLLLFYYNLVLINNTRGRCNAYNGPRGCPSTATRTSASSPAGRTRLFGSVKTL